ncbi:GNAT family N-acetyltransferase [Paenibacillus spongiae]|uniref:GNAT family N-acetyltransferase n=1 Tax=Paenibacillus spongiae TaxID=2909671 RepID=A0ABY5S282_9BACL|nr:GNAT family N-acetyltransferase [Paenibacillus spongiae]UVI27982.1 GNAT family N-acetyltransferase [Paenibacillus spongiae]
MAILSKQLAEQIEQSEIEFMTDRMAAIRERQGNPERVEVRSFGSAKAFISKGMPWPQFNAVKGFGPDELPLLPDILAYYEEAGCRPQFEITPIHAAPELLRALSEQGFVPGGFHASFYTVPEQSVMPLPSNIRIRRLERDEMTDYARIHCLGFGMDESGIAPIAINNGVLHGRPGWQFYVGLVDGEPAAAGVLYIRQGTASLTFAATLPKYRSRGLHYALLRRRIHESALSDCRLIVSQAAYLSPSHRNMERAGMKLAYTRINMIRK